MHLSLSKFIWIFVNSQLGLENFLGNDTELIHTHYMNTAKNNKVKSFWTSKHIILNWNHANTEMPQDGRNGLCWWLIALVCQLHGMNKVLFSKRTGFLCWRKIHCIQKLVEIYFNHTVDLIKEIKPKNSCLSNICCTTMATTSLWHYFPALVSSIIYKKKKKKWRLEIEMETDELAFLFIYKKSKWEHIAIRHVFIWLCFMLA